jgi:regulator of replication initiation timing
VDNFGAQLKILFEILVKKRRAITQILTISENQETILLSKMEPNDISAYFAAMNSEKQALINEVIKSDDLFQDIFNGIKDVFDENAKAYKDDISALQSEIRALIEMDTKIRLQEEKNKSHLARMTKDIKKIDLSQTAKERVIKQYGKNASWGEKK